MVGSVPACYHPCMTRPLLTHSSAAVAAVFLKNTHTERYGLELIEDTGSTKGTVYPMLITWEQRGWLTSRWETDEELANRPDQGSRRRYYRLTDAGQTQLTEYLARWQDRQKRQHVKI
jgi:PadR family transcriptional regulator PadR